MLVFDDNQKTDPEYNVEAEQHKSEYFQPATSLELLADDDSERFDMVTSNNESHAQDVEDNIAPGGTVISSKLQIHVPKTLTKPDGYEHREALFGIPPYGGSIAQNMYYANADLCDAQTTDTRGGYPIRAKDGDAKDGKMLPWQSPYILMVDRGGCTFVQKVRNAQRVGAVGVIIADNSCLCSADQCTSDPGHECEEREPIMADDGSGSDISIPSFLMFKQDADEVKAEVMANHAVRIEMIWSLPSPDDRNSTYSPSASPTKSDPNASCRGGIRNVRCGTINEPSIAFGSFSVMNNNSEVFDAEIIFDWDVEQVSIHGRYPIGEDIILNNTYTYTQTGNFTFSAVVIFGNGSGFCGAQNVIIDSVQPLMIGEDSCLYGYPRIPSPTVKPTPYLTSFPTVNNRATSVKENLIATKATLAVVFWYLFF